MPQQYTDAPLPVSSHASTYSDAPLPPPPVRTWGDTLHDAGKTVADSLPMVGAVTGGALATPESFGWATAPAAFYGGMAGQAGKDLIYDAAGWDKNGPAADPQSVGDTLVDEVHRLGTGGLKEGGTAAATQGLMEAALPIWTGVMGIPRDILAQAEKSGEVTLRKTVAGIVRRAAGAFGDTGSAAKPILERPPWQNWAKPIEDVGAPPPGWSAPPHGGTGSTGGVPPVGGWSMPPPGGGGGGGAAASSSVADDLDAALRARGLDPSKVVSTTPGAAPKATPLKTVTPDIARPVQPTAATTVEPPALAPSHPQTGNRVAVGAEDVGRALGKTKQQVRDMTGPLYGEQPGEPSPAIPDNHAERIINKLKGLPKEGPERDAYVAAAPDPKSHAQILMALRTLRNVGMGIGGASLTRTAMQDELDGLMRKRSDGGQ